MLFLRMWAKDRGHYEAKWYECRIREEAFCSLYILIRLENEPRGGGRSRQLFDPGSRCDFAEWIDQCLAQGDLRS